jgi:hypothetical protein
MKYLILWQITDWDLATSWHNGSATHTYVAYPYETYESALSVAEEITNAILQIPSLRESNFRNKYCAEAIVLAYNATTEDTVNKFFEYDKFSNSYLCRHELNGIL